MSRAGRNVLTTIVTAGLVVVLSAGAASARHYSHPQVSLTATSGGTTVASATAQVSHGYVSVAGGNVHSARFVLRDRSAGDGRAVYGRVIAQYRETRQVPRPGGGKMPSVLWVGAGSAESRRTSSTLSATPAKQYSARPHSGLRTIADVCVDIRLRPDNCAGRTFTNTW